MNKISRDLGFTGIRDKEMSDMITEAVMNSERPSELIERLSENNLSTEEAVYVGYLSNETANDPMIRMALEMRKGSDINQDSEGTSSEASMQKVFEMLKAFSR